MTKQEARRHAKALAAAWLDAIVSDDEVQDFDELRLDDDAKPNDIQRVVFALSELCRDLESAAGDDAVYAVSANERAPSDAGEE